MSQSVSKCVQNANDMTCVSACEEMGHGPTQTGDMGRVTDGVILETAPAPQDAACEIRSVFCERPRRARLRDREATSKRSAIGMKRPRGQLEWWRLCEFGKHVSPCEHVRRGRCALGHECCSRNESRWRHRRARLRCKPRGAARVRVTSRGSSGTKAM